jgi:hypothetical protein
MKFVEGPLSALSAVELRLRRSLQSNGASNMNGAIMRFVKNTTAVEAGFIAAGLTVSIAGALGALLYVFGF